MSPNRTNEDVHIYNDAALAALDGAAVVINDLYDSVAHYCGEGYSECGLQKPANVHCELYHPTKSTTPADLY